MPFQKGNTIGQETRFKKGQVANPAGRPPDKLRRFIHAELDKIGREATDKQEAATKLQVLAERIVEDAISGCIPSRKMLVDRLYPALSRHEIATAQGEAIQLRWESEMKQAADELQAILNARSDDNGESVADQKYRNLSNSRSPNQE